MRAAIVKTEPDDDATPRESAVSNGLAESLAEILTLTVRDDQEIHLQPSQARIHLAICSTWPCTVLRWLPCTIQYDGPKQNSKSDCKVFMGALPTGSQHEELVVDLRNELTGLQLACR